MRTLDAVARILKADIGIKRAGVGMADFFTLAQEETRARSAAFFRPCSLNEALAGLRRGKKAGE